MKKYLIVPACLLFVTAAPTAGGQSVDALCKRGKAAEERGDYDAAISCWNAVLELNPRDSMACTNRGFAKKKKGDLDGALADFNRAIVLNPKNGYAYCNRGLNKRLRGDLDGAIADYNRAIELEPNSAVPYNNRGSATKKKGDLEGAIADYNRAIELDPNFAIAYNHRGNAKSEKGDLEGALADYQRFCELSDKDQDYPRLYIWLIRARLGETRAANRELSAYVDERWKATSGVWLSKVAGHLLGRVKEADLFAAAASLRAGKDRREEAEAWYFAGMKKLLSGNKKAAAEYFRKCVAAEQKLFTEYDLAQSELKALGEWALRD